MKRLFSFVIVFLGLTTGAMAQKVDLSIFPKPEQGYKQMVIEVPHSENDGNKKLEFRVGKWMDVDGCNSFKLNGVVEKKDLQGWGYDYYVFSGGGVIATRMACPDAEGRHMFVSATPETARYNGRMPIVIYVPTDYEVKFKIYQTDGDDYEALEVIHKQ